MSDPQHSNDRELLDLFPGDSQLAGLMRTFDWAATPLGPVGQWPPRLRLAVSLCLDSGVPTALYWGPEFILLYNDAWSPILGDHHPGALGRPAREVWTENRDQFGPTLESVVATRQALFCKDRLLPRRRQGHLEEYYYDFTTSPIRGPGASVDGIFQTIIETTSRVLDERRMQVLRELARDLAPARSAEEVCTLAAQTLGRATADVPFALLYLLPRDGWQAELAGSSGVPPGTPASPLVIDLGPGAGGPWPLAEVLRTRRAELVCELAKRFGSVPGAPWPERGGAALVLPVPPLGQGAEPGVLIAGISPQRTFDQAYRAFFQGAAEQIGIALASAAASRMARQQVEALAEANRARMTFFSNVSHEFRTPLTLLLGPLEDLLGRTAAELSPAVRSQLEIVQRNSLRLLKLVNTLLDFSRLDAGRKQPTYQLIDLPACTAELASVFRSAIEQAGLELVIDCPPLPELVSIDPDLWERIVLELLGNAFKYTLAGRIEVRLRPVPGNEHRFQLFVRDTGVGIPAEELPHVFERFYRGKQTSTRSAEGTGIGLALVQDLVELHGGQVGVWSAVGRGTTFIVTLPLRPAQLPADRVASPSPGEASARRPSPWVQDALGWLLPEMIQEDRRWPMADRGMADRIQPPLQPSSIFDLQSALGARPRILWVENNPDLRAYVGRFLAESYDVEALPDGAAALAAARARPPDLVLCGMRLAGLDGFGLVQALRVDPGTRPVPVILLSARAGEESHIEGLEAGADDYLVKPFSARELLARVAAHLNLARIRQEAEKALRESAAFVRSVLDSLTAHVAVLDRDGKIVAVNEAWQSFAVRYPGLAGLAARPGPGANYLEVQDRIPLAEDAGAWVVAAGIRGVIAGTANRFVLKYPYDFPPGEWFLLTVTPFRGDVAGAVVAHVNITDLERAEAALRESEARLQTVLETMPAAVYTCDASGLITWFNRAAGELWGRAPKLNDPEDRFCGSFRLYHADGTPVRHDQCFMALAVLEGTPTNGAEAILERPDGTRRFVLAHANPLRNSAGQLVGAVNVLVDITERRGMQEALQASEARIQAVVATAADAILTIDERGILESANPATEKLFGYRADELIGQNVTMLMPSPYHEEHDRYLARYLETGEKRIIGIGREAQGRRKDGSFFPVELAVSEFQVQGRRLFTGVIRDISARKQLEREVLEVATLEQRRIGQALHDSTGQELTALTLLAETLSDKLEQQNPGLVALAAKLGAALQRVLSQVRAYSRGLIPVEVDSQGLRAALVELASRTSELHGIRCTFDCPEPVEVEDTATATHLFHIAQEAVTNALRHSQGQRVTISLESDEQSLTLRVNDDGLGLRAEAGESKGVGLKIMTYRASLIQARLTIERGESAGTVVTCTLNRGAPTPARRASEGPPRARRASEGTTQARRASERTTQARSASEGTPGEPQA
jgi:PAS domain S-box-containing protein